MIKLSVGIPSRNRPISLYKCLEGLNKEKDYIYEIIVSNDSSDKYNNIYNKVCNKFGVRIIDGPRNGLYANHNQIYKIFNGTHLRLVDDDHTFPENHFKICLEKINNHPADVLSFGESYPLNIKKVNFPGELNARGFSSKPKNYNNSAALSSGASIFPKTIFKNNLKELEVYQFGMTWLEFGKRLQKLGINIRVVKETHVIHHYNEFDRSYNSKDLLIETTFFVMLINNLIYEKKIKNYLLMFYEIFKKCLNLKIITNIRLLSKAYKNFKKLKNEKYWNFD